MIEEIKLGIYQHYKGPLYQVLGLAHDANADSLIDTWPSGRPRPEPMGERMVVVYMPLQLDGAHLGPRMAVRTLEDFLGLVWVDQYGKTYKDEDSDPQSTHARPRFEYLGISLTQEMLDAR